jgi:hypothetical protein
MERRIIVLAILIAGGDLGYLTGSHAGMAMAQGLVGLEVTKDWCRSGDVIHVFRHDFDIDGSTQRPIGDPGEAVVIRKGVGGVVWDLTHDRWRWHCGEANMFSQLAGVGGGAAGSAAGRLCASVAGPGVALCPAVGYAVGQLVQGFLGNWEAARCSGATRISIDFQPDGRIVWTCYGPPRPARKEPPDHGK